LEGVESVACCSSLIGANTTCAQLLVEAGNVTVTLQAFSKAVIDIAKMADVSEEDLLMARPFRGAWSRRIN